MSEYIVTPGDTFEIISRREYGTEAHAGLISSANPGALQPLTIGSSITIPTLPARETASQEPPIKVDAGPSRIKADDPDEVAVLIDGRRFRFWESARIMRSIDSMDTIELTAPFDHEAPGFRETFRPLGFQQVLVYVGGEKLFSGTAVLITPSIDSDKKTVQMAGYSIPGVLNDCTSPADTEFREFDGFNLRDIASSLCAPFGLSVKFDAEPGSVFDRVANDPDKKVLPFLIDLAQQRNLVVSSSEDGQLLCRQSVATGSPVAVLRQGEPPLVSVLPSFSPQDYYSHITAIEPVATGADGSQYTVKNSRLKGVTRPFNFLVEDTQTGDIKQAAEAKASRMFAGAVSYGATVVGWRDPAGNLWKPNTTIKLLAPDAMVYTEYEFAIRSVVFERGSEQSTASLELVLPGSFRGELPESLPWD